MTQRAQWNQKQKIEWRTRQRQNKRSWERSQPPILDCHVSPSARHVSFSEKQKEKKPFRLILLFPPSTSVSHTHTREKKTCVCNGNAYSTIASHIGKKKIEWKKRRIISYYVAGKQPTNQTVFLRFFFSLFLSIDTRRRNVFNREREKQASLSYRYSCKVGVGNAIEPSPIHRAQETHDRYIGARSSTTICI